MSDLISRQAAIDAFWKLEVELRLSAIDAVLDMLKSLPSAEPKTPSNGSITSINPENTHDRTMGDLISRQAVIDALRKEVEWEYDWKDEQWYYIDADNAIGAIERLPSAEPEVIRCKDCKHRMPYDWMFSEVWQSKNMEDYPEDEIGCDCCDMNMRADDFCSRAERRGEEE